MKRTLQLLLLLAIVATALAPLAQPAQASAGIPLSVFDPYNTAWASVRNMSSNAFHQHFLSMKSKGYMVIDLEVSEISGNQRVGAVWMKNPDGRGWASWRNLTSAQFSQKWNQYKDQGYRLIDQGSYTLGGTRYYSGVWMQNVEGLAWASWRNLTSAQFSDKFDQYKNNYIPVDVEAYRFGSGTRYAVIWVENTDNLDWILWRNMTASDYGNKFQQYKDEYRVHDIEAYRRGSQQNYAAVWIENKDNRYWQAWRDMSAKQFGDKWLQLRDAGYRLTDYEVYDTASGYRYAGVWRQNTIRPDWGLKDDVNDLLQEYVDDNNVPGMSVAIAKDGQFKYLRGFGHANIDDDKIATSRTVYALASISKAIGGTLMMQLAEQDELDLDEDTRTYVPTMPNHHTHTVEELASNRSGVGHYEDHGLGNVNTQYDTALEAAELFWDDALVYTPGNGYKYSTHGYTLLGAAMEGAVGDSIGDIVEDELTDAHNLPSLRVADHNVPNGERATWYDGSKNEVTPDNSTWKVLGGGLEASAYDLARFGMKLLNGSILSDDSLNTMWTAPDNFNNSYALGWELDNDHGTQAVGKNGRWTGATTYLRMYPDEDIVIVVLINRRYDPHIAIQMGKELGDLMLNNEAAADTPVLPAETPLNFIPAFEVIAPDRQDEPDLIIVRPMLEEVAPSRDFGPIRQPREEQREPEAAEETANRVLLPLMQR